MNLKNIKYIYFLGVGGIGMSALARFFNGTNIIVSGYDKTETPLTQALQKEGIEIAFDDQVKTLKKQLSFLEEQYINYFGRKLSISKNNILIVRTPAVPAEHKGFKWLVENDYNIVKRSELLGLISKNYYTIAVAGTHGKTTTSTMIAHILKSSGVDVLAFLGGISTNYQTNYIANTGEYPFVVVEADEFDRSFLHLKPDVSIVTATDADHLDIYGNHAEMEKTFIAFSKKTKKDGILFAKKEIPQIAHFRKPNSTYSIYVDADINSEKIKVVNGDYKFTYKDADVKWNNIICGLPGSHNVENATAAIAVCKYLGLTEKQIKKGLKTFAGVKRRFEYIIKLKDFVYIDDYAHHPEELKAAINSAKMLYKDKKITGIFQPHLYSRTRDFAKGFAESLDLLDEIILMDIYPAREKPMKGVTSKIIFDLMKNKNKVLVSKENLMKEIKKYKPEVLLTLGAGDVDTFISPLKKYYSKGL
ncbi:MAG: UDP-N-acetylmuramate--L-alanine ligase [Bacteroidota bacterium]|nr:UDP-N-acetylmuramate--L-alanine ligase [Bacteroidota bacterium]